MRPSNVCDSAKIAQRKCAHLSRYVFIYIKLKYTLHIKICRYKNRIDIIYSHSWSWHGDMNREGDN